MWYNFIERENKTPGSLSSLIPMLAALVLLIFALASSANDSKPLLNIYMMEIDISNINWDKVISTDSSIVKSNWQSEEKIQRHGLFSQCIGKETRDSFEVKECDIFRRAFDIKYFIAKSIRNVQGSWVKDPSDLNLPKGAIVSNSVPGAAIAFLVMSTVWVGLSVIFNILDVKYTYIIKFLSVLALFISNLITSIVARRVVNSLNDHQDEYGIKGSIGQGWLRIVWVAFGVLVFAFIIESGLNLYYTKYKNRGKQNDQDDRRTSELTNVSSWNNKNEPIGDSKREIV
ncbi:putative membrane protein [Wickerhamomyces ciferrii]|uniref:Membrane protein n=1 Tax=Wickerhamomyces ciferrii (strain ATCC 14091 / BCRC 22168 / CBS 111 / JCM 3599 / NBRC 0793 / NRRL Y-1031 F-60-10) TaxID=1206466 RepID=K0KIB7_WICCF|nr:uncharacterized protein BN7_1451 [Wickerhamomyces ciferrii]CCH41912.1 putative membrane protein [Wickerhamomyces ciferrii]